MEKNKPVIHVDSISKSYQTGFTKKSRCFALKPLSFSVYSNEVFGIIGPNGAGKSTLLKILMNFIKADTGEALIYSQPVYSSDTHKYIGYLPEHPSLASSLTPFEVLAFACQVERTEREYNKKRIPEILSQVNLAEVINTPLKKFSKGMLQRTALAYAMVLSPKILILDEPMSGLDPLGRQLVVDLIHSFKAQGTTIIFCSHILSDVERICDRIGILNRGELATVITPDELSFKQVEDGKMPLESLFLEIVNT